MKDWNKGFDRNRENKQDNRLFDAVNNYIHQGKEEFLKEVVKHLEDLRGKISSTNKFDKEFYLSVSKAIYLVSTINKLHRKEEEKRLDGKEVLYEAAKLIYIGNKEGGKGRFWFNGISNVLKENYQSGEKRKRALEALKLIVTYLAAYAKK